MKIQKIKYNCKSPIIAAMLVSLAKNKGIKPGIHRDFDLGNGYISFAVEKNPLVYQNQNKDLIFDFAGKDSYYANTLKSVSLERMIEYLSEF